MQVFVAPESTPLSLESEQLEIPIGHSRTKAGMAGRTVRGT